MTTAHEQAAVRRVRKGARYVGLPGHRAMVRRLVAIVEGATAEQWQDGVLWYARFEALAGQLAERNGVTCEDATAVLAILSPRCAVATSVVVADELLAAWSAGGAVAALRVRGVLPANVERAVAWLGGDRRATDIDVDGFTPSRKVRSFFANIRGDLDAVTVDVWATRAVGGTVEQPAGGAYVAVAEAYRSVARRFDIAPRDLQAVVWCAVRSDIDAGAELDALAGWLADAPAASVPAVPAPMASVV